MTYMPQGALRWSVYLQQTAFMRSMYAGLPIFERVEGWVNFSG